MSKYQVTLHRYLQQKVTVEVEPEAGVAPIDAVMALDRGALAWESVNDIHLSSDCIILPEPETEPEEHVGEQ